MAKIYHFWMGVPYGTLTVRNLCVASRLIVVVFLWGTCKVRNEIQTKRNETERNETKPIEMKRNEM